MTRIQIGIASVGVLVFSVFIVTGTLATQTADLADGGYAPTHIATCQVRLSPECRDAAGLHTYERVRFPISMRTLVDGGRDVQMPPMALGAVRRCVEVVDWSDCALATAASAPAVAARWGTALPFTTAGTQKKCVRAKFDAGLDCLRIMPASPYSDGGVVSFGDRNVFPRAEAADPATCEPVECGPVFFGENPDVDL